MSSSGIGRHDAARRRVAAALPLAVAFVYVVAPAARAADGDDDEPAGRFLQFVDDFAATCTARNGVQRLIRNTHPTRTLRVWLDRYHMGQGTGDRSRTDLPPGGEPQPLGCSRSFDGPQEWRLQRAVFVD